MTSSIRSRVDGLIRFISEGRIIDAMNEFYSEDTQMQENANPPCVGLAANIEREEQFASQVKEWKGFQVKAVAAEGDVSFMETAIDFVSTSGAEVHAEQVSVQRWKDGKIVHERFYYDTK